jgi:protoheme IX farnesyltransferase
MERTASRRSRRADLAARGADLRLGLAALSFVLLSLTVNVLAASLALGGFVGYVGVYTIWLKRRTPQNIVIGGAAGAIPPLVGWAATRGSLSWTAVYLFAIVFYWTPPHFWALSLLMKDEYAKVGVPMLPVVRGERETRKQILLYSLLLYAVTQLPFCAGGSAASTWSPRWCSGSRSSAAPCCSTAAPTAARRCAVPLLARSTSRCCSARWSPTSSCRIRGRAPTASPRTR